MNYRHRHLFFILQGFFAVGLWLGNSPGAAQDEVNLEPLNYRPPNRGAPGERQDAGSRPGCPSTDLPFTAIMPTRNWGTTVSDRPTVWFAVPPGNYRLEWEVMDRLDHTVLELAVDITEPVETDDYYFVRVDWPEDVSPPISGDVYQWYARLFCDPDTSTAHWVTRGALFRENIIHPEFEALSARDRVVWLAEQGVWLDMVTELLSLRSLYPNNLQLAEDWQSLMSAPTVNLELFSDPSIAPHDPIDN
jgi:hypothetical protein